MTRTMSKEQKKDAIITVNKLVNENKLEELCTFLDTMSGHEAACILLFSCHIDENLKTRDQGDPIVVYDDDEIVNRFYEISQLIKSRPKTERLRKRTLNKNV